MLPLFRRKYLLLFYNRPPFSQSTDKIKANVHNIFKTLIMKLRVNSHIIQLCFLLHTKHTASSLRRPTCKGEKLSLFIVRLKRDTEIHCAGKTQTITS